MSTPDRTGWREGPWDTEPNQGLWEDPVSGYICQIRRGTSGALCGYVVLPRGHRLHGKRYSVADFEGIRVHGGVTYTEWDTILPDRWVVGFDCAHSGDYVPALGVTLDQLHSAPQGHYRTWDYVKAQVHLLATQLLLEAV